MFRPSGIGSFVRSMIVGSMAGAGWLLAIAPSTASAQGYGGLNFGIHGQPRQRGAAALVSARAAERAGLKREWFTAVEVDRAHGDLEYATQHVSFARGYVLFDVEVAGKRQASFSERDINTFQEQIGPSEAQRLAEEAAARYIAEHPEAKATTRVVKRDIPEVTIFASTSAGMVHAIDGETGRTRWAATYGTHGHPTLEVAANDEFVGVVNGMRLYVVHRDDGRLAFEKLLKGVPGAGPRLSDELIFVPTLSGFVECYQLHDPKAKVMRYNTNGKIEVRPTVSNNTASWPTSDGKIYTANANTLGIRTRRILGDSIQAPTAVAPPNLLIAAAADGFVECLDELRLQPIWRFSTGDAVLHPPIVVGANLFVVTEAHGMYCIDPKTGAEKWFSPDVLQFLSASEKRVYCCDTFGRLSILDLATGGQVGRIDSATGDVKLINPYTDRILIGSRTGLLQCLREPELDRPLVHIPMPSKTPAAEPPPPPRTRPASPGDGDATEGDDSGTGEEAIDPFGGSSDTADGDAAEGEEGAASAASDEDPFGE